MWKQRLGCGASGSGRSQKSEKELRARVGEKIVEMSLKMMKKMKNFDRVIEGDSVCNFLGS